MHWLGIDMAEASQPIELLQEDWDDMNAWQRTAATKFWDTRRKHLRRRVAEESTEIPSLRFSESFKKTGVGPVYTYAFSPDGTSSEQFHEIPPHQLANIFGEDTYSGISGCFVPARIPLDDQTGVPDVPADLDGGADAPGTDSGPTPTWRPNELPTIGSIPIAGDPNVFSLSEQAAIRKMHRLIMSHAAACQPPHLENDDWELWSKDSQATAIKV